MSTFGTALIFINICTVLTAPFLITTMINIERDARRGVKNCVTE